MSPVDITSGLLVTATGCKAAIAASVVPELVPAMTKYEINTPLRMAHFIAQCAHESGLFAHTEEDLRYRSETMARVWPRRFYIPPDAPNGRLDARDYEMRPDRLANAVYANRMGNGPPESGDGWKFRGRGYIGVTGAANYKALAEATGMTCVTYPDIVSSAHGAALSAAWFWATHGCNDAADMNSIEAVTRKVNGGLVGIVERTTLTKRALAAFGLSH